MCQDSPLTWIDYSYAFGGPVGWGRVAEAYLYIALSRLIWGLDFQPVAILITRSTSFHSKNSAWTPTGVERPISDEMTPSSMSVNSPVLQ